MVTKTIVLAICLTMMVAAVPALALMDAGDDANLACVDTTKTGAGMGSLTISKEIGDLISYKGSITGGYSDEGSITDRAKQSHNLATALGEKGSWFQYNDFEIEVGPTALSPMVTSWTFDLVQGDKLKKVGEYTITWNGGKNFTITIQDETGEYPIDALGAKLSISNNITAAKNKNDSSYNANNIWTTAPGQQKMGFSGNSFTFTADWLDISKPINVYMHLEGLNGYVNIDVPLEDIPATFDFLVMSLDLNNPYSEVVKVPMNKSKTVPLAPGLYEIIEMTPGWTGTFTVGKDVSYGYAMVNITAGKTTTVKVVNEPTGTPMSGPLAIWKAIITADDDFIFGDGFEFAAFEEDGVTPVLDEDGNPVTGISSGDEMGMVFFPSVFDVNKNYIIKEITVSPEYVWGPENPDGFILFEGNGFFFTPVDSSGFFYNVEVSKGDLGISASVAEKYVVKKYVPQFEPIYEEKWKPIFEWQDIYRTDGYNSTIVSSVNNGVLDADKGVTGGFINRTNGGYNGFTYLEIDVALLAEQGDAGFNVNLAQSNMSNGNSPNSSWNTPLSGVYNVKIVDGQLVVTCDLVSGSFGVLVADKEFTYNPTSDIKHDNNGNLGEVDGIVYLFFHMSGNAKWQVFVETKKVYIGKEFLGEKLVDVKFDKWVLDSVSEPKIRNSGASLEVLVTDADGGFVYQGEPTALTDLTAGDYEVSLIINGDVVDSQKVTVIAGDKVSADFDPFYLWGDPVIKKLPKSLWSVPDFPEWVNVP